MKFFVIALSKLLYWIGKLVGKGSSLPGKIALKLDRNILRKIKLPEDIIVVTGSNGKTSTVEMICKVLEENGYRVGCNKEGSNQTEGVTTMILNSCNLFGQVKKDVFVIESDERYTRHTFQYFTPKYLVITNLYRDQMTRNGHPELIYDIIGEAICDNIHLVLNTDDPLSSLYGYKRENVTYFGMNQTILSKTSYDSRYHDGKYCPNCKKEMQYDYYHYNHIGSYHCLNCGHERKEPEFAVTNLDLKQGMVEINQNDKIQISLRSIYNVYNVLATYAVTSLMGLGRDKIVPILNNYIMQNDRIQTFRVGERDGMLLTSKHENSISYNQSLAYIVQEKIDCTVVIMIDAISRKYFTSETSWIWDIDFETLHCDCVKKIILAGKYAYDLASRFSYTEIEKEKIVIKTDLDDMMTEVKENGIGKIYVVTCFSDRMKFMNRLK